MFIRNVLLMVVVVEAGKSRVKVLAQSVSGEGRLSGSYIVPSSYILTWRVFFQDTNPIMMAALPTAPFLRALYLGDFNI